MPKRHLFTVFKVALTAALFFLLFRPETFGLRANLFDHVSPGQVLEELREAGATHIAFWLTFAAGVRLAGMLAGVLRWKLLLRGQGLNIPFWYMVKSWFIGRYFGIFLPGTLGLDVFVLVDSSFYTGEVIKCATVIAIEKLIGFISLTFLVFLTFPLGFKLLKINPILFAGLLVVLGGFVLVSFLLLLNPRVIQVLVAVLPTPAAVRGKFNKLGAAVTAYSGSRADLLLAVVFGILVHLGACFMYFGTMMAIRAPNTNLLDILFASPLMIYGTVIGPTVGGEGIRELVFVTLLGGKSGTATALTFAHLGWWVGDVVPFLVGWALLVLRPVRPKGELKQRLAEIRKQASQPDEDLHLTGEQIRAYRGQLINYALAGITAGLIAGAIVGLAEAKWIAGLRGDLTELGVLCWGPMVYGILFAGAGLAIAGGAAFVSLLWDRFVTSSWVCAFVMGKAIGIGALGIGGFRFYRDVLGKHNPTPAQLAMLAGAAFAIGLTAMLVSAVIVPRFNTSRTKAVLAALAVYLLIVSAGGALAAALRTEAVALEFNPPRESSGPNIIFIGIDALRADYLRMYNPQAAPHTPRLDAFAKDAVLFKLCFAQVAWTKPSFATMFTGLYPSSHTATSQTAVLPESVATLAEALRDEGYYTQGYSNNGNIERTWNFQQGFVDYVDLKPGMYFGAPPSAVSMTLYQGLRKVRAKLIRAKVVTDFYQPAEVVTSTALTWLDGAERPRNAPFYLFLHYMDPHDPFMDHTRPGVGYARAEMENPDPAKYQKLFVEAYAGEVEYLDRYLGVLFDGLRRRGLYDDTVILVTSDHGEEFHEHQGWWHGQTLYDEMTHVPLLIKWGTRRSASLHKLPINAQAGTVNEYFARHVDLAPTLLHLAGAANVPEMQGISLFDGAETPPNAATEFVYSEEDFEGNVLQAVRTRESKLIRANEDNKRNLKPLELYDMVQDPLEQANLAGTGHAAETALGARINGMLEYVKGHAAEPVQRKNVSDELREQLNAIGYN